ncbi:MAG: multicomponent Na+:H+ antiporter subunit D, partial [Paraglaciecola sp.]
VLSSIAEVFAVQRVRAQKFLHRMAVNYLGQPHTADSKERGVFARSWPVGTTALWIAGLLSAYVLLYYL